MACASCLKGDLSVWCRWVIFRLNFVNILTLRRPLALQLRARVSSIEIALIPPVSVLPLCFAGVTPSMVQVMTR